MKVIKHGNQARDWTHEAACSHCGCVMEVSEGDVTWRYVHKPGAHPMHDTTISEVRANCPDCRKPVLVCQFADVPRPLQERMRDRRDWFARRDEACRRIGLR